MDEIILRLSFAPAAQDGLGAAGANDNHHAKEWLNLMLAQDSRTLGYADSNKTLKPTRGVRRESADAGDATGPVRLSSTLGHERTIKKPSCRI